MCIVVPGGIVLMVLAVGSTAPGLLQVVIDKFSQVSLNSMQASGIAATELARIIIVKRHVSVGNQVLCQHSQFEQLLLIDELVLFHGPQVFPDYKERVITHESAHFLLGWVVLACKVAPLAYTLTISALQAYFCDCFVTRCRKGCSVLVSFESRA